MNPYRYDIQTLERKARAVRRHIVRLTPPIVRPAAHRG